MGRLIPPSRAPTGCKTGQIGWNQGDKRNSGLKNHLLIPQPVNLGVLTISRVGNLIPLSKALFTGAVQH